jgi:chromosomal replication initiator protein
MYLAKVMTIESMPKIGRVFGRDHTTVLHGVKRIKALYDADPDFAAEVEAIRSKVAR